MAKNDHLRASGVHSITSLKFIENYQALVSKVFAQDPVRDSTVSVGSKFEGYRQNIVISHSSYVCVIYCTPITVIYSNSFVLYSIIS